MQKKTDQRENMRLSKTFVCLVAAASVLIFALTMRSKGKITTYNTQAFKHQFIIVKAHQLLGFNLVDPEQAPPEIRESVMRGYHLIMNTSGFASEFGGNQLDCANCHFAGGDTLGGKNGGISLVGV